MSDYDNTNTGALFKNEDKESEKHPDFKGTLNVDGTEYWVSSWVKLAKSGKKYMSLSVQAKDAPKAARKPSKPSQDDDDGIPF